MSSMGIEIDYVPVGDGERTGDAIAVRYGNLSGPRNEQTVVVIDGGFEKSGQALVEHIKKYFNTTHVDFVVSTHPDGDHVKGLKVVLEELSVGLLLMHLPWNRSDAVKTAKQSGFTAKNMTEKFEKNFQAASELADLATAKGITTREPFAGLHTDDGVMTILSPTESYYNELLAEIASEEHALLRKLTAAISQAAQKALSFVDESWHIETLTNAGDTSPQNNSSVVTLFQLDGKAALLTADAGIHPLGSVAGQLEALGLAPGKLWFVQVPHHGSRRNVGPDVLNRLLGPKGQTMQIGTAFVTCAIGSEKHPAKKVTNAFLRRGYPVHGVIDSVKAHRHNAPQRFGWVSSTPFPLHPTVPKDEG